MLPLMLICVTLPSLICKWPQILLTSFSVVLLLALWWFTSLFFFPLFGRVSGEFPLFFVLGTVTPSLSCSSLSSSKTVSSRIQVVHVSLYMVGPLTCTFTNAYLSPYVLASILNDSNVENRKYTGYFFGSNSL